MIRWHGIVKRLQTGMNTFRDVYGYIIVQGLYAVLSEWDYASAHETNQKVGRILDKALHM